MEENFSKFFLIQTKNWKKKEEACEIETIRDLNKSADLVTFQKKSEKSRIFQQPFGNPAQNRILYDMNEIIHGYFISVILIKFRINGNI